MKISDALTIRSSGGIMRQIISDVYICLPHGMITPRTIEEMRGLKKFQGVWDTGATNSVITAQVVSTLSLKPTGQTEIHTANKSVPDANTYLVDFVLGNVLMQNVEVVEGSMQGLDVLIGMDIITLGDFAITNKDKRTVMSFRVPSMKEIDFIPETNDHNMLESFKEQRKPKSTATKKKKKSRKKRKKK